jgi:cell division septation protein DedD
MGDIHHNMSKREEEGKYNIGRNALMHSIVICIAAVIISSFAIPGLLAQETGAAVEVRVTPESEYVEEGATFSVTIDVDDVTEFKNGNFDLSFNSSVLELKDVENGRLDGEIIPIISENLVDADTVRVVVYMSIGETANGSGHLAEVSFKVKGAEGDKSVFDLSNGKLSDKSATEIHAEWKGAEIKIGSEKERDEKEEEEGKVSEEVTPGSPEITVSKPAEAVIGNVVRESRTFNISVNQIADISWQINGSVVQTNESVKEAAYTNTSAAIGSWNVSAIATNATTGLSDTHTWIWCVTLTATPAPTLAPRVTPAPTRAPGVTPTPKHAATTRTTAKPKSTPTPTPKPAGFDAIFAIAMLAIAYVLLREK